MASPSDCVEEGSIDRNGDCFIERILVPRVGAVLRVSGDAALRLERVVRAAQSAWVGRVVENVDLGDLPHVPSCVLEYTPGISLLSLLAQSSSSGRPFPVQAAALAVHDAALGLEAVLHARARLEPDGVLEAISPISVRIGFNGSVAFLPTINEDPALADIIGVYPLEFRNRRGIELGPQYSPEAMRGIIRDASEPVFFLGALLALTLGGTLDMGSAE
jgi:hypothetical protein